MKSKNEYKSRAYQPRCNILVKISQSFNNFENIC